MYILSNYQMGIIDTLWPFIGVFLLSYLFYIKRNKIRNSHARQTIPWVMFALITLMEIPMLVNFSRFFFDVEQALLGLPLHLCSTSAVLVMLFIPTRKEILLDILILQGIIGASITFIFPNITEGPLEFEYYRFMFAHMILFLVPLFFMIIEKKRISIRHLGIGFIAFHAFGLLALFINLISNHDYMYITSDPNTNIMHFLPVHEMFPSLGNLFGCILFGEILAIIVFPFVYVLLRLLQKKLD